MQTNTTLAGISTEDLLVELSKRGGAEGACAETALLFHRKGKDYNQGVQRDAYFPFGLKSYAHMVHLKALRLVSLSLKDGAPIFDSARDTLLDCIAYAAFGADWLDREGKKPLAEVEVKR